MNGDNRILMILSYIHNNNQPINAQDISKQLLIPLSTVYRILRTLKAWGFITDSTESDKFVVGPTTYGATATFQSQSFLANNFRPFLAELVKKSQETAAIITPTPYHTLCVDLIESPASLKCSFSQGSRQSLVRGASAKTILAFQDERITKKLLTQYIHQEEQYPLQEELNIIKNRGYGLSTGEIDADVWGVSFPLFKKEQLIAVLTTMVPAYRVLPKQEILIHLTQTYAHAINEFLLHDHY